MFGVLVTPSPHPTESGVLPAPPSPAGPPELDPLRGLATPMVLQLMVAPSACSWVRTMSRFLTESSAMVGIESESTPGVKETLKIRAVVCDVSCGYAVLPDWLAGLTGEIPLRVKRLLLMRATS